MALPDAGKNQVKSPKPKHFSQTAGSGFCSAAEPHVRRSKTAAKKPVKNADLWQRLDALMGTHDVDWRWVRGHAGHAENERADQLARDAMAPYKKPRRAVKPA